MRDVLVKFPTRARPQLFQQTLKLYQQDEAARFLITIDADDASMTTSEMMGFLDAQPRLKYRIGVSKTKVEAVNDGLNEEPWDGVCIVASDDMTPQRPDYARRISELFDEFFPDGDGVLHLNDGRVGRKLNTISILDRVYFNRFGYCYAPCYRSTHCDNEFQEVSERLGRAVYVNECVIKHDWIGEVAPDDLHRRNESLYSADATTFKKRRDAGFPA